MVMYINMSSKKTTTWSTMSLNKLFIICMNIARAFVNPMGIMIHLYSPYWVKNSVFGIYSSAIQHYQYLL